MRKITDERLSRQAQQNDPVNARVVHSSAIRAALAVAKDYPVFPCDGVSKRPLVEHGFKAATRDATIIARWWRQYPEALIGVPMGTPSGLVAIDVDPEGRDWYREVQGRLGAHRLHGTRRGKHLLYRVNGTKVRNSTSVISDGIDVRGEGGYIIWWPAHGGVSVGEPGELPDWLERAAGTGKQSGSIHKVSEAGEETLSRDIRKFKDGERGTALSNRAYHYRKMGLSTREIGEALLQYDLEHCEPPYQQTNGKSAVRYIARKKGGILSDGEKATNSEVELLRADEQKEVAVDWLWKGFLARNKFHLLSGSGGVMKSTLALSLTATITRGGQWPDDSRCPTGNVLIWTGEDDLSDTVRPRLRFAGADLTRCWFVKGIKEGKERREFDPAQDASALERACVEIGDVSMIVIDPIVVVVQKDNNSASDVRRSLTPLADLAAKYNAVLLGIQHFTKGSKGKDPAERVLGSGAWVHRARIVLAAAAIDEGEGQHANNMVFTCVKTFAKSEGGFEYGFEEEPKTEVARIVWGRQLQGTGHHIISEAEGGADGESKLGVAKKFLRELLSKGSMDGWEIAAKTEKAGIKPQTYIRARDNLGLDKFRSGKNSWRWKLPDVED